jgi:hypothetical protein
VQARFCDEFERGFGWIVDESMQRCSHALAVDGSVWLIDPLEWEPALGRLREHGEPRGVIQLLDRHGRDCAAVARRLGVAHHEIPDGTIPGAPFEFLLVRKGRRWQEVALWWPSERVLVCADALGTAPYYRAGDEPLAVHPILRLIPPRRRLGGVEPARVLCGHGEGVHGERAAAAFREALATARRRLPRAWASAAMSARRR